MPKLYEKFNIKENNKIINILNIVKTWILVSIGMLIFRAENLKIFREMFLSIFKVTKNSYNMFEFIEAEDFILLIVGLIILILSARIKYNKINLYKKFESLSKLKRYWICFILFFIVIIFGAYGAGYMPPDPIYGGF